jgi:hypothetical protein
MAKPQANANGRVPLSAVDFLGLAKQRKVARLDLGEIGYEGVIYVRNLSADEQSLVTSGKRKGKSSTIKVNRDESYEMSLDALAEGVGAEFLRLAVVTDEQGGAILEEAFATVERNEDGELPEYITVQASILVQMEREWMRETGGNRDRMLKELGEFGGDITDFVVAKVKKLSGMGRSRDRVEEKKENS